MRNATRRITIPLMDIIRFLFKDRTELAVFLTAFLIEIAFGLYLVQRWGYTFSCGDDISHVYKARIVVDNGPNSGLGNLGVVWLPLFQILLVPLVLIDPLYTTGFAGTIVNALVTGGTCVILFRMLESRYLKGMTVFLFLCNVFTLIYGSVPMNVQLTVFFMVLGAYYFKRYWKKDSMTEFLNCSLALIFATLTRYEAWGATLLVVFLFALRELRNRRSYRLAYAHLPLWGIFAWLFWNMALFRYPLAFLSHPLHAPAVGGAGGWMMPYAWSLELTTVNVINEMSIISGLLWIVSAPLLLMLLMKRSLKFIIGSILLIPIFLHGWLCYINVSVGLTRFFYLGYVGLVLTPLLALDGHNLPRTKSVINGLLVCALFFACLTQVEIITVGTLSSYHSTFSSVNFPDVNERKSETLLIKKVIGNGSAVLCPFNSLVSGELSVYTSMSPSIFYDGYDCEQAMAKPWTKYGFVIFMKKISDYELTACNDYIKSVYGVYYYEYSFYRDPTWREKFLTHYLLVLETSRFLVFRRI